MESLVSRADLESLLATLERQTVDPRAGLFGPNSITWKISRESALFLGSGRAALLQLAHPWVAAAIAEHSTVLNNPVARFHNTFRIVFAMIFGSRDQAFAAARHLHTLHTHIRGELPEAVAGWPHHAHYEANELAALCWVFGTLIEGAVLAYESVLPLTAMEREQYYQESRTLAALFGIPSSALPADWAAFTEHNRSMHESDVLGVNAKARAMGEAILSGAGSWIHPPRWYGALTAAWMPPRLRDEFGLQTNDRVLTRAVRWLPCFYTALPATLRFVGPYHEALARLRGRDENWLTRRNNTFWIGEPLLPFRSR
ncbi:MAG TPA: oxygenase MpaB family protein [Acidobacteriaceae bacterium]|nr:oxygenase MpaB family protein [Acidobacteriaceae bacterium]